MRNWLGFLGQILLVVGTGIILLAGSGSVLYADDDPATVEAIATFSACTGCSPCGPDSNGNCKQYNQCIVEVVAGACSNCVCTKGTGTICVCQT